MAYKIVFSDIDGTVLNSSHKVLPSTAKAVRSLCENSVPFVLVSARMPKAMRTVINEIIKESARDISNFSFPLISYSGALALDEKGRILYDKKIPAKDTEKILFDIKNRYRENAAVNYYAGDEWYAENTEDFRIVREEEITSVKAAEANFSSLLKQHILPNKLLCITDEKTCADMEKFLRSAYPSLKIVRSSPVLLEIMHHEASKSNGIKVLLDYLNLKASEAIAFGDNYNDADMLEFAGLGAAMGNAPQEVKEKADIVTDSNDSDGIYNCLKKLKIIK